MLRQTMTFLVAFFVCQVSPGLMAHHGFTAHFYPDQIIRIEGTVTRFDFINPHGYLFIETRNESGEPVEYMCDLQARSQLLRRGADETLFRVGEQIVVEGFKARRNPLQCEFGVAHFADGSTFTMRSIDRAQTQFAQIVETDAAKIGTQTLFGKWIRPGLSPEVSGAGPITGQESITDAGQQALDAFDPISGNPVVRCEVGSPVRTWRAPGLVTSVEEKDGNVHIYHESMDVTRTVYMQESELPLAPDPSDMGFSIGKFEDDELIIDSTHFKAGVLTGSILNSDQMTMQERLSINDDGRLSLSWVVTDPIYYSEPIRGSQILRSTTQEIIAYDCVPEEH